MLGKVSIGYEGGVLEVRVLCSAGVVVASPFDVLAVNYDEFVVHDASRGRSQPYRGSRLLQLVM